MKKSNELIIATLLVVLSLNLLVIWGQIRDTRREEKVSSEIERLEERFEAFEGRLDSLEDKMGVLSEVFSEEIGVVRTQSARQFTQTQAMNSTYENLLAEERKTRVDSAAKDNSIIELTNEGDSLFASKKYGEALKKYRQALDLNKQNPEIREKKLRSLYLVNPMDSSNYREILEDCRAVKAAGKLSEEAQKIENSILLEQGKVAVAGE